MLDLTAFFVILIVLIIFTFGIDLIGNYLSKHFSPQGERITSIYQGGEKLPPTENRYETESYYFTFYFMILHVIGFIIATMMILPKLGINTLNFATAWFWFFSIYTIYMIKKLSTR